jgi:hypothetical protein
MSLVSFVVEVPAFSDQGLYENRSQTYSLGLAKIIPATFILETINLPPPPGTSKDPQ